MNTFKIQNILPVVIAAAGLAFSPLTVLAEDAPVASAPPLAYGVPQILKLSQAKVTDDVIIAYIHNSGSSYGLDADQIIYLRQQGISDKVLTTMLAQPRPASVPAPAAPVPVNSYPAQTPVAYAQPAPAYAQSVPASSVYVMPNNQIYYSSGYYAYYPYYYPYSWYGGYHGGGYYRGGYCGGNYNGYHGGVTYASRGASYHGGGGFSGSYHGGGMMHR